EGIRNSRRGVNVGPDVVPLYRVAGRRREESDSRPEGARAAIARDHVPGSGRSASDDVVVRIDLNPEPAVADRRGTGGIRSDEIALNGIAVASEEYAALRVARNQIAEPGARAADHVVESADIDPVVAVGHGGRSVDTGADVVAQDQIARHAGR